MTTAMIRKKYITPEVEVFDVELENMVATSPLKPGLGVEGDENYEDEECSNKRQPEAPWGKSPWE